MKKLLKWTVLVAVVYLPLFYFIAAHTLATKVPNAAGTVALAPYACGLLLIAYLVKGEGRWRSGRGLVALPLAGIGHVGLAAIFAALIAITHI
jgi:Zn-dependent alcohol dehydrogenase